MDTFSLYDELPLFSGDLLVGWSPLADELPAPEQDAVQQDITLYNENFDVFKSTKPIVSIQELQENITTIGENSLGDTKVNVFDILQSKLGNVDNPVQQPVLQHSDSFGFDTIKSEDLLHSVSEMLIANLSANKFIESKIPVTNVEDISESANDLAVNSSADSGVLSSDEFNSFLSDNVSEVEDILNNSSSDFVANILSPVSPEDVEYILSSGPTSPYSSDIDSTVDSTVYSPQMSPASMNTSFETSTNLESPDVNATDDSNSTITISMKYLREELLKPPPGPVIHIPEKEPESLTLRQKSPRQRVRHQPYSPPHSSRQYTKVYAQPEKPVDSRKQRKKQQNKDAALRYRYKKREEKVTVSQECDQLEEKNNALHEKVDSMTREIQYLKDLLAEVYKAKSASNSKP